MADLLYTGDRILIGAIASFAVIAGISATVTVFGLYAIIRGLRRPTVPAADDNEPGRDVDALWECRRIDNATQDAGFGRLRDAIEEAREEKP
ncbi:hypothetical protein [Streptomyces sp. NPDC058268]|uniref:hypothetical protein n=1 Tax=Streptomyces sp. NPDC058268 TaxID=3346413 RepID=UPI0036E65246